MPLLCSLHWHNTQRGSSVAFILLCHCTGYAALSLLCLSKSEQKATPHILVSLTKLKCLSRASLFCLKQVKKLHLENRKLRGLKSALRVWEFVSFHSHLRCWHVAGTALSSHLMPCLSLYPKPEVYRHGALPATLPKCSVQGLLRACTKRCLVNPRTVKQGVTVGKR